MRHGIHITCAIQMKWCLYHSSSAATRLAFDLQVLTACTWWSQLPAASSVAAHSAPLPAHAPALLLIILEQWWDIIRANPSQDHSRALRAAINRLPAKWHCQTGRPRWTWLRTIELDVCQCNIGIHSAWQCAHNYLSIYIRFNSGFKNRTVKKFDIRSAFSDRNWMQSTIQIRSSKSNFTCINVQIKNVLKHDRNRV